MNLKNKIVLVTGAGKGIGFNLVLKLLKYESTVYGIVKSKSDLSKFKKLNNCHIICGNINNKKTIQNIFNISKKNNHIINGLVNNAGIRQRISFSKLNIKDLRKVFEVNFFAQFECIKEFINNLLKVKKNGSIVNIASIVGQNGFKELCGYASTKSALIGLSKSIAVEFASKNIRCNVVSPGFIKTSFYKKFKKNKKLYNWTISRIPLAKWGEADEVSESICFLLSDNSRYITGETLNVDGGWLSS